MGRFGSDPRGQSYEGAPARFQGTHSFQGVFLITLRFTDSNIYYQKYGEFENVNLYRESLFQVLPRSNFDIHDQLDDASLTYPLDNLVLKIEIY